MLNEIKVFENDAGIDERGSIWTTWKKNEWKDMDFNHDKFSISKQIISCSKANQYLVNFFFVSISIFFYI